MRNRVLTSILVSFLAFGVLSPTFANPKGVPNSSAAGYWTQEKRDNAIAREFQFEPGAKVGKLVPQAKRGGTSGGTTTSSGTSYWPSNQQDQFVANITGKVFFTMNGSNYVCSGSLINDGKTSIAVVITAGHCVWDNTTSTWATNWAFFPNYDSNNKLRAEATYAARLYARTEFTSEKSFSMTAVQYDYAFAVINTTTTKDFLNPISTLPSRGSFTLSAVANAFGYPQASPFNGNELVVSKGTLSSDPNSGGKTWKLASSMTGGASGGPWYSGYSNGDSVGTVGSVNSYKYSNDKNSMYGPMFSGLTDQLLSDAINNDCLAVNASTNCANNRVP